MPIFLLSIDNLPGFFCCEIWLFLGIILHVEKRDSFSQNACTVFTYDCEYNYCCNFFINSFDLENLWLESEKILTQPKNIYIFWKHDFLIWKIYDLLWKYSTFLSRKSRLVFLKVKKNNKFAGRIKRDM